MTKHIIICTIQNSGLALLCEDMFNTGILGHPKDYFSGWAELDHTRCEDELKDIIKSASSENGVHSVAVMSHQISAINQRFSLSANGANKPQKFEVFYDYFKDYMWVHLTRRNYVKQAVSAYLAQEATPDMALDAARLDDYVRFVLENRKRWDDFFEAYGITPIKLASEDVFKDGKLEYINDLVRAIGQETTSLSTQERPSKDISSHEEADLYMEYLHDDILKTFAQDGAKTAEIESLQQTLQTQETLAQAKLSELKVSQTSEVEGYKAQDKARVTEIEGYRAQDKVRVTEIEDLRMQLQLNNENNQQVIAKLIAENSAIIQTRDKTIMNLEGVINKLEKQLKTNEQENERLLAENISMSSKKTRKLKQKLTGGNR